MENIEVNPPLVLVKPFFDMGGGRMTIDENIDPNFNGAVSGKVVKVPEFLPEDFPWETDMELMVGDDVMFSWMASQECVEYGSYIVVDNEKYYLIPYDQVYCGRREKRWQAWDEDNSNHTSIPKEYNLFGINGNIVIEEFVEDVDTGSLEVPLHMKNLKHMKKGIVRALGKPNKSYRDLSPVNETLINVKVGDVVLMDDNSTADVEYYKRFFGGKTMYCQQRRYIQLIIK